MPQRKIKRFCLKKRKFLTRKAYKTYINNKVSARQNWRKRFKKQRNYASNKLIYLYLSILEKKRKLENKALLFKAKPLLYIKIRRLVQIYKTLANFQILKLQKRRELRQKRKFLQLQAKTKKYQLHLKRYRLNIKKKPKFLTLKKKSLKRKLFEITTGTHVFWTSYNKKFLKN